MTNLRGSDSFPLHQVLHLAVKGDPSGQNLVLFSTGQPPCCPKIAADWVLEVGQLAVGVYAVNYVCGMKPWQWPQHLRSWGVWVYSVTGRWDLWVGGLQGSSRPTTFPLQRWRGNGHDAGCRVCLAGATEAGRQKRGSKKKKGLNSGALVVIPIIRIY